MVGHIINKNRSFKRIMKNEGNGSTLASRMWAALAFVAISTVLSCSKGSDEGNDLAPGNRVALSVSISQVSFEDMGVIGSRASSGGALGRTLSLVRRSVVDLGEDLLMVAELTADTVAPVGAASAKIAARPPSARAATETGVALPGIRYKTVVFDGAGTYVTQKDYVHGQEAGTDTLQLESNTQYTFIVYSVNSTSVLPNVAFPDPNNMTLASSSVSVSGNQDFMYFRRDMTLSATAYNYLDVVLRHQFSQVTTTVDATATGYNVTAVSSGFTPHSTNAVVSLGDAGITRSGDGSSAVSFPAAAYGGLTATGNPTIINAATNGSTSYTISSITVGPLTQTNIVPFTDLGIVPGVRYSLRLNIVPTDEYLTHEGLPAARINGTIWARHNVGVDTSVDPDADPMDVTRHGDYFQWGRLERSGGPTASNANPYFASNAPANNTWNSGTEEDPVKTAADPCPSGFRIPTRLEQQALVANTVQTNLGPFQGGNTRFDSAKIFTSRRNSAVRLTLPAQGHQVVAGSAPYNNNGISNTRGSTGRYHSSFSTNNPRTTWIELGSGSAIVTDRGNNPSAKVVSLNIRCVAE